MFLFKQGFKLSTFSDKLSSEHTRLQQDQHDIGKPTTHNPQLTTHNPQPTTHNRQPSP